ncbi:MAG: hypothetical protein IM584_00535 [Chitinophagaceae bacterium]|nr:hypothetical protein [Chitinophagaceae bacterium]MEA3425387.1 hypothetical protein [Bacteroidota bacterium]MCA6453966.1 hypothetical protein [Chitinophagaceae bacterium]MCA6454597.1 hypothetical protein [Chitinophagaceae bacterium]MCA6459358.1 hypothetical protein [Chitinophagaceae bacterium]
MKLRQKFVALLNTIAVMPYHRNFTYWIDKRVWKYYFLMLSLQLSR